MKRTMVLTSITATALLCAAGQAQIVISQVHGGGGNSGATYRSDFVELKNIGNTPVAMNGWSVQYTSAAGTVWQVTNLTNVTLNPGQYYLVKQADGANVNATPLPTPDATGTSMMSQSNGKVALVQSTVAITGPADPNVLDFVGFGTGNAFEGAGAAPAPSNALAIMRQGNGCQDTNDNSTDFELIAPNPRNSSVTVACGAVFPDLSVQITNGGCNPSVGSSYALTAQVSNALSAQADGTVLTLVLPPTLTYLSNTGGASYNNATRTLTWNIGTVAANGTASINVNTEVASEGGLVVKGSVTTTTPNEPAGNNSATSFNNVTPAGAPLSTIAVGSFSDTSIATTIFENIEGIDFERKLGNIYRVFTSQNGQWIIFRTDLAGLPSETNGAVIVGNNTGTGWSFTLVAREGTTAPLASLPNAKIDNSGVNTILGINNSGQYVYSAVLREGTGPTSVLTDVIVKGTTAGITQVIAEGDAATAPELAGRSYTNLGSSTIQNDGTVSFYALLTGSSTTNSAFLTDSGATVVIQKGVTLVTGSAVPLKSLDTDGSTEGGRGFIMSADGVSYSATGRVDTTDTTTDDVVIVNGSVVLREGSTFGSFSEPTAWTTFGSVQIPWVQMNPDGNWHMQAYNVGTAGTNQGLDWTSRNGVVTATTNAPVITGNGETWNDGILQRTFFAVGGDGNRSVVGGLTSRSLPTNGSDTTTDGLIVQNGGQIVLREGTPVDVSGSTRYLSLINDHRSFVIGNTMYVNASLINADSFCQQAFGNLPSAIVAVPLPALPTACAADLGVQGGQPGQDGILNNNDFIVFIDYFFNMNPLADRGVQGGQPGSDGLFNNNDFIVFIDQFFAGCGN